MGRNASGGGAMGALAAGKKLSPKQKETIVRQSVAAYRRAGERGRGILANEIQLSGLTSRAVAGNVMGARRVIREEEGRISRSARQRLRREVRSYRQRRDLLREVARRLG